MLLLCHGVTLMRLGRRLRLVLFSLFKPCRSLHVPSLYICWSVIACPFLRCYTSQFGREGVRIRCWWAPQTPPKHPIDVKKKIEYWRATNWAFSYIYIYILPMYIARHLKLQIYHSFFIDICTARESQRHSFHDSRESLCCSATLLSFPGTDFVPSLHAYVCIIAKSRWSLLALFSLPPPLLHCDRQED